MQTEAWMKSDRFKHITRPYKASDVIRLRPPVMHTHPGTAPAKKMWKMINDLAAEGKYSHTFGALDTVQVIQMAKYLTSIYVSGWQCSSTASTTNEPGFHSNSDMHITVGHSIQLYKLQFLKETKLT